MDKEKNIKVTALILDVLAKNKCTVEETSHILRVVESEVRKSATVQERDYSREIIAQNILKYNGEG
ncbi:MAG: hypothetical protein NC203_00525 [Firmicutes bacterium]|nr:hypothetical protein [[Eubacterium] siraeum]MCM1486824.1 hypothetical protein [Bacillota bacterium]